MEYCNRCILPSTRPGLVLDSDGICSACRNFELRGSINWTQREKSFKEVVASAKERSSGYDCLIPVSGGKDSTWQTVVCLEQGMNPLCVTWKTPGRTEIGERNLKNLISLGVDHIDYTVNPEVEKTFMLKSLEKFGSTAIPMHLALFNIPLKIANSFGIPLVVWGENSAFEYGDPSDERLGFKLTSGWLNKYGVTHGTKAIDWQDSDISEKMLTPYNGPNPDDLEKAGTLAIFLGYYFQWDIKTSYSVAKKNGFLPESTGSRTGIYDFADIDDHFISIHHYLKWYKFGFLRTFDNLSLEIRHGRLSRDKAIKIAKSYGESLPQKDIELFCDFVGIGSKRFFEIIETFRNNKIWKKDGNKWKIPNFLIKDWIW